MKRAKLHEMLLKVQKPAQYVGGEWGSVVKSEDTAVRFAFCFPDTYEIGMSHLGMKILYQVLNDMQNCWCERVFAPWLDFEKQLLQEDVPLYALESMDALSCFDIIGFTLQYELSYTTILQMLHLGRIPMFAKDRTGLKNLVIAGGPCACNPEPLTDFIDLFLLGEGEEQLPELVNLYDQAKRESWEKAAFLKAAAKIGGVYVPSLYDVTYHADGRVREITPKDGAQGRVKKRLIGHLDEARYPDGFVVPFTQTVHDRAMLEIMRGCIRGCRFCQAGFLYRPLREKSKETLFKQGKSLCQQGGFDEISLSSLSSSDYSGIESCLQSFLPYTDEKKINVSLPSLRVDQFSKELLQKVTSVRKSGLTFAPEAGTQRLRDVINKNVTEQDVMNTCKIAFEGGYTSMKLYFMIGLPTETPEDVAGIVKLAGRVVDLYYETPNHAKGGCTVSVSVSTFVPKPFTPFAWEPQDTKEQIEAKQKQLLSEVTSKKIRIHYHDANTSILEGVLARGDRRLGRVLYRAWELGCYFDSWGDRLDFAKWEQAFSECGLDMAFYAHRRRAFDEVFPWSHLDYGVSEAFLQRENQKAHRAETTPNCREHCAACDANSMVGGKCFA